MNELLRTIVRSLPVFCCAFVAGSPRAFADATQTQTVVLMADTDDDDVDGRPDGEEDALPNDGRADLVALDASLDGATLKVAVAHGTANARKVMEDIKAGGKFSECHFIEFMACPGGCLGGGGQPIPTSVEIRAKRAQVIYAEDSAYAVRKSHENPAVLTTYAQFLTDGPCGHKSHKLLHTTYTARGKFMD